jgi:orotate phosphoribosyltransferase
MAGAPITSFIVRKEVKGHGTEQLIEGDMPEGEKVAIVDDVCTTGSSVFHAIEAVEEAGCEVVKVVVLVDRCQGGSDELRRRGYDLVCLMQATPEGIVEVNPEFAD